MFTFDEWYCQYQLYQASEAEKATYISRSRAQKLYRSIIKPDWRTLFHDKRVFIDRFKPFIKRHIAEVNAGTPVDDVIACIRQCGEAIVKPVSGSLGNGIFKVYASELDSEDSRKTILERIYSTESIIEQCIHGCDDLQKFHPLSLNTIRVVTVFDGVEHRVFGSFFRMGCGDSVVDNAHAGGIFAHIDINKGTIDSDGINTDGKYFATHPDSHLPIKGTRIPLWENIKQTCTEAHKQCPNFMVGWDVVVNSDNQIEFIEGNHAPDMDVMQSPLKKGIKSEFMTAFKSFKKHRI